MMPWLKLNMEANTGLRGLVQTRTLYWGDPVAKELLNADVILGADIMYASSVHGLLLKTLLALSKEDTVIYLAHDDTRYRITLSA